MAINIQGTWTIAVKTKNPAALPQRYIITGATSGNGVYDGYVGAPVVTVTGNNWQLNIQANDSYDLGGSWVNSSIRTTAQIQLANGQRQFDVQSEDLIQDSSWDDLVLTLTSPAPSPITPPVVPPPVVPPPVVSPPVVPSQPPALPPSPPPPPTSIGSGKVYTRIEPDDVLPSTISTVTYGIWSDNVANLTSFYACTSSVISSSYYRTIYNATCGTCDSEPQFDVAYGHDAGSGSADLGGYDWMTPTNAIYSQYRLLCLGAESRRFTIGTRELSHVYIVNVKRDRMGDSLDEGNIELNLAYLSGSQFLAGGGLQNAHTGSNVKIDGSGRVLRLIDDSRLDLTSLSGTALSGSYSVLGGSMTHRVTGAGKVFYMVSGSLEQGVFDSTNPHVFGLLYPQLGVIVLDADKLDATASFLTVTGSDVSGDNNAKLFTAISGAALYTDVSGDRLGFQARRKVSEYAEYYFIRVKNSDYNFSNNPTFVSGSEGFIKNDFVSDPKVYFTTVGLYNEQKELLAVGKVSRAIQKSYTSEALLSVKLKY